MIIFDYDLVKTNRVLLSMALFMLLCILLCIFNPIASVVYADDIIISSKPGLSAGQHIDKYYDKINLAKEELEERIERIQSLLLIGLSDRRNTFYRYHRMAMWQSANWAYSKKHKEVSRKDMIYIGRGFQQFMKKHKEIMSYLDEYEKLESSDEKNQIKKRLKSYRLLRLFSPLNVVEKDRIMVEEVTVHPERDLISSWVENPLEFTLRKLFKKGKDKIKIINMDDFPTKELAMERIERLKALGYVAKSVKLDPNKNNIREFVKPAPILAKFETKLQLEGKSVFVSDSSTAVQVVVEMPESPLVRDKTKPEFEIDDKEMQKQLTKKYKVWVQKALQVSIDRLKEDIVDFQIGNATEKTQKIGFKTSFSKGNIKVIGTCHIQRKVDLPLGR